MVFFLHPFQRKIFRISGKGFLQATCPSCHPSNSVKALTKKILGIVYDAETSSSIPANAD